MIKTVPIPIDLLVGAAPRFWKKVHKTDGCWEWTGSTNPKGYGRFWIAKKFYRAHRLSWVLHSGRDIPDNLLVLHQCDNPPCIRQDHLFLGTVKENSIDAIRKGQSAGGGCSTYGEAHPLAKLTEPQVIQIREEYADGHVTLQQIANTYCVKKTQISRIISGKKWSRSPGRIKGRDY